MNFDTEQFKFRVMCYRNTGITEKNVLALKLRELLVYHLVDTYGLGIQQNVTGLSITGFSNMFNQSDDNIKQVLIYSHALARRSRRQHPKMFKRVGYPRCEYAPRFTEDWAEIADFRMEPIIDTLTLI